MEQKNQSEGVNTFAKCLSALRDVLDENKFLAEYPEAKTALYEKYSAFAKMLVQGSTYYSLEIITKFVKIINHEI